MLHTFRNLMYVLFVVANLAGSLSAQVPVGTRVRGFDSPGDKPEGLAWDGQHLWSNNFNGGTLYKIDANDGRIVAQYVGNGLPSKPEGLAWDGEFLWTCHWVTGLIYKIRETATGMEIVEQFLKPEGTGPSVGLAWDGSSLWLSCFPRFVGDRSQLYQLDPVTHEILQTHILPVWFVEDLAWDGQFLWSSDWLAGKGFAIEPATGDTLLTYKSPGPNPVGNAWDGTHLWVTDTTRDSIYALDISAAATVGVESASWSRIKALYQ